jgi:hypothetical protein
MIARYRLTKTREHQLDLEIHRIHKMSYIFDEYISSIYMLTDRNQIYRCQISFNQTTIHFEEQHIYGCHAYNISSIAVCTHKPWLITLDADHCLRIFDYKNNHCEILSQYMPDDAYLLSGR